MLGILLGAAMMTKANADLTLKSLIGRVGIDDGLAMQWPATGVEFSVDRWPVEIWIEDFAPGSENHVAGFNSNTVMVDSGRGGMAKIRLKPGQNSYKFDGRGDRLRILKATESSVGKIRVSWEGMEGLSLQGLSDDPPVLEVYGDSNTAGYGVEALSRQVNYSPSTANATKSYAFLAAESAGMELHMIAASGWGVMRGYGGSEEHNIPSVIDRIFWQEEDSISPNAGPNVILVMLGDNDFAQGDPGEVFDERYLSFVRELRERSPQATILLGVGSMMADTAEKKKRTRVGAVIDMIIETLGDEGIAKIEFPRYDGDWGYGADWHFSARAHKELAPVLVERLRQIQGR